MVPLFVSDERRTEMRKLGMTMVAMHVWLWHPNPSGLFAGTNPLMAPFNQG